MDKRYRQDIQKMEEKVVYLYIKESMSCSNIAKMLGCDFKVIKRIIIKNGYNIRPTSKYILGVAPRNKLKIDESKIIDMYNQDISGRKIAKYFKCDPSVIYDRLNKLGIKLKCPAYFTKGKISPKKGKTFDELYSLQRAKEIKDKIKYKRQKQIITEDHRKKISCALKGKYILDKHPHWRGGTSFEPYTLEFTKQFRNKIRQRDNQVCMNCGKHREQLKRALSVHHINCDKKLTIPENCISLCNGCHSLTNFNREYWTKLFQDKLSHLYGYKYEEGNVKINLNYEAEQRE